MVKTDFRKIILCIVGLGLADFYFSHQPAQAQLNSTPSSSPRASTPDRTVTEAVPDSVFESIGVMTPEAYEAKAEELTGVLKHASLNPYETSLLFQMLGSAQYELGRIEEAVKSFDSAIEAGGFNAKETRLLQRNIALLLIGNGEPERGATLLETLHTPDRPLSASEVNYVMQAWVQLEQYDKALPWAEAWFENAVPKERKHYDLMNFLYSHLGKVEEQIKLLKAMIERNPSDISLWQHWGALLVEQGRDEEAFIVWKQMYALEFLTKEQDFISLAKQYGRFGEPHLGADILEKEMKAGRVSESDSVNLALAGLRYAARDYDRAEKAYSRIQHHNMFGNIHVYGKGWLPLPLDYFETWADAAGKVRRCDNVSENLNRVEAKNFDAGKAWVLVGICYYETAARLPKENCWSSKGSDGQARLSAQNTAMKAFEKVPNDHRQHRDAKKWIEVITAQKNRDIDPECGFDHEKELCYIKIRQAYDAQVFTNKFELDEECEPYKAEFDRLYRQEVRPLK